MSSHVPDIARLHDLAQSLFTLVRDEYDPPSSVTLHLEQCEALVENPHSADAVVQTLVNAQVLAYATRNPAKANPRYVIGLGLFADDLIPTLLKDQPRTSPETAQQLHEIRGKIDNVCMDLALRATPGMEDFFGG
jgi:hypothetical protein